MLDRPGYWSDRMITRQQLSNLRQLYGYSLREVGAEAGLSHMIIKYVECGERPLIQETAKKILFALYRLNERDAAKRAGQEREEDGK